MNEGETAVEKKLDRMIGLMEEIASRGDGDRLMSILEVGERLGTRNPSVMKMIRMGMLPAIRFRTVTRVRKVAFERFLEEWDGKDILSEADTRMAREEAGA